MKHIYFVHVFVLLIFLAACGSSATDELQPPTSTTNSVLDARATSSLATQPPATRQLPTATRFAQLNGLYTISLADLPDEALVTLDLIHRDGPFPYRQDGGVFQNRERLLPRKPNGYYHEYTVETPGSDDRGARRIITGQDGEFYYTDDHYESFKVIIVDE